MPTFERMGVIARGLFEVLAEEPGGLPLSELHERVYGSCRRTTPSARTPPSRRLDERPGQGAVDPQGKSRLWFATELVPAGAIDCGVADQHIRIVLKTRGPRQD